MTVIVGIDPGAAGYISVISETKVEYRKIPHHKQLIGKTNRSIVNIKLMLKYMEAIKSASKGKLFVFVERQQPMAGPRFKRKGPDGEKQEGGGGSSVSSAFLMGANYYALLNSFILARVPYEVISPVAWKKHFALTKRPGEGPQQAKQRAADLAVQYHPDLESAIARDRQHGLAESLLIARFGAIKFGFWKEQC